MMRHALLHSSNRFSSRTSLIITLSRRSSGSSSSSSSSAPVKFLNRHHHHNYVRTSPTRTNYTSSQSSNNNAINKPSPRPQRRNKSKYLLISFTAFVSINAFGTYTHFHDDLFQYYPLPFALDVGMGPSMLPTLTPGKGELYLRDVWSHRSIISRTNNDSREYKKGDVVTIYNPYSKSIVTKRIVGVGGDTIRLYGEYASEFCKNGREEDGGVTVDERFDPPYCQTMQQTLQHDFKEADYYFGKKRDRYVTTMKVPPNHVWVEGDNPLESTDSRHYGPLPISALRGRIVIRLCPLMSSGGFYRLTGERPSPFHE